MARPDARRKGLRRGLRLGLLFLLAAAAAFPVSFMTGMMLTPMLWRLEPVLGMELAGHSGPSDWILETLFAVTTLAFFSIAAALQRRSTAARRSAERDEDSRGGASA